MHSSRELPLPDRLLITGLCALAGACGLTADGGGVPSSLEPPRGADQLVLRMAYSPGFGVLPEYAPLPAFSLYGDGRILMADPAPEAPARRGGWQRTRELHTGHAGMQRLLRAASAAGLGDAPAKAPSTTANGTPDAPSARFTLREADGGGHEITVTRPQTRRGALGALFQALSSPAAWLGHDDAHLMPYRPEALAVLRRDEPVPVPDAHHWPLDPQGLTLDFPGPGLDAGQRTLTCTVLHGNQAGHLATRAAGAPQSAQWTDGRHTATLELRPLLPDEKTCHDLRDA